MNSYLCSWHWAKRFTSLYTLQPSNTVVEKITLRKKEVRSIAKVTQQVVVVEVKSDLGKNELNSTSGKERKFLLCLRPMVEVISWSLVVAFWEVTRKYTFTGSSHFLMTLGLQGASTAPETTFLKGMESIGLIKKVFIILQSC